MSFRELKMIQRIDGALVANSRELPSLSIRIDAKQAGQGPLSERSGREPADVAACATALTAPGTWTGLLADPWPGPWIETPPIMIQNATLELIPDNEPKTSSAAPEVTEISPTPGTRVDFRCCRQRSRAGCIVVLLASTHSGRRGW